MNIYRCIDSIIVGPNIWQVSVHIYYIFGQAKCYIIVDIQGFALHCVNIKYILNIDSILFCILYSRIKNKNSSIHIGIRVRWILGDNVFVTNPSSIHH